MSLSILILIENSLDDEVGYSCYNCESRSLCYNDGCKVKKKKCVKREFGERVMQEKKRKFEWDIDVSDKEELLTTPFFPRTKRSELVDRSN